MDFMCLKWTWSPHTALTSHLVLVHYLGMNKTFPDITSTRKALDPTWIQAEDRLQLGYWAGEELNTQKKRTELSSGQARMLR